LIKGYGHLEDLQKLRALNSKFCQSYFDKFWYLYTVRDLIKKILHEETRKSLVPMIRRLIDGVIVRQYEKEICDFDIDVIESGEYKVYLIIVTFDIDPYQVMAHAFVGSSIQEDIMNDIFMLLDSNFDIQPMLRRKYVKGCKNVDSSDEELSEYSRTLKNARQQGVGLRFPKSAVKSTPMRFRPYNR